MKAYISGNITGIQNEADRAKFENAENCLVKIGYTPINPLKIQNYGLASWSMRLEYLSNCEAIYLLSDWLQSPDSIYEKYYCDIAGKEVFFENLIEQELSLSAKEIFITERIKGAIQDITGYPFKLYIEDNRIPEIFFCRMIFIMESFKSGIDKKRINKYIPRDYTTILHCLKKYSDEYSHTKGFREIADKVISKLQPELMHSELKNT